MAGKQLQLYSDYCAKVVWTNYPLKGWWAANDPGQRYSQPCLDFTANPQLTDEPRRSGRSTKGQHKSLDMVADAPMKRAKSKSFSKDKSSKPSAEPTPGPSDDEEELIRCICGQYEEEEDVERDMICCDQCSAWQHNDCMGLSFPKGQEPDQYFCEGCKPENHKDLLERIAQGEKPWEEVAERRRKEAEDKKSTRRKRGRKGGRRGRPSESKTETSTPARSVKGQTPSSAPSVPPTGANVTSGQEENGHGDDVPTTDTPKRKFDEDQDSPQEVSVSQSITYRST